MSSKHENTRNKQKAASFEAKVRSRLIIHTVALLLAVLIGTLMLMGIIDSQIEDYSTKTGEAVTLISSAVSERDILEKLMLKAEQSTLTASRSFVLLGEAVNILKQNAELIYQNASDFNSMKVDPPRLEDDGIMKVQITYSEKVNPNDPAIVREQGLIGNLGPMLYSANQNNPQITSCYYASESGFMVQADALQHFQFDETGNLETFEARERPWYLGAVKNGGLYFTDPIIDAATQSFAIIASAPVYRDGELMGVVGAGVLLTELQSIVDAAKLSDSAVAFIVDRDGFLVSISDEESLMWEIHENKIVELLQEENELTEIIDEFIHGYESATTKISISGEDYYISYTELDLIDWSFISLLPASEADVTTQILTERLDEQNKSSVKDVHGAMIFGMILLVIGVILILLLLIYSTRKLIKKLLEPIRTLTGKVRTVSGDNLTFSWERDTGDEIDQLGGSFALLTERIKTHIRDITAITAEKERIGAELSVATRIQADMLPCIFPPYPDRKEFDLYASMTPAKEVGGDFYDFFMVDDDHLAMVIGDVSGKGVPAALFMVISKTLIKDHAMMISSPKELLERVNQLLVENNAENMFVTIWLGILEISTGKIKAANAGHEYPALCSGDGEFSLYKDKHGMMAGIMEGIRYTEYEMQLEKGGCLFVYTDGVPEATDADNKLYKTDRMLEALNRDPKADPKTLLSNVRADIDRFVGTASQFDDLTMLAIRYYGKSDEQE